MSRAESFAGYSLMRRLDAGGRVEFHEAQDATTGARAVLVRLPEGEVRWPPWAEPLLAAVLVHPNIVRTLDYRVVERRPTALLELVPGRDLRELLADTPRLPVGLCWFICREILNGLAAALESRAADGTPLRWTHGWVCPRAIRISTSGEVKLGWFGIGRLKPEGPIAAEAAADERLRFIAPEQADGLADGEPEPATDVFLVGAILHELLTGGPLLGGRGAVECIDELRGHSRWTFSRVDGLVSAELAHVTATTLARDPADRYRDAGQARDALDCVPEARDRDAMSSELARIVCQSTR